MLTRHLYRIDEVKAVCKYALLKKNYREALFWSMELVDTLMIDDLRRVMISAWFEGVGRASYTLLLELIAAEDDDILGFVGAFCCVERDASIYSLLTLGSLDWVKQPNRVVPLRIDEGGDERKRCTLRAIKQGKTLFAWTLLRCHWDDAAWELLLRCAAGFREESTIELLRDMAAEYKWESRAAALVLLSDKVGGSWKPIKQSVDECLFTEWSALEGRRARRIFAIRPEAITYGTTRGELPRSQSNIQEIREPLTALYGSPYWDTAAADFGGWRPIYKSDEAKETFYELYFPDDIPDEWSRADQEKSHGTGLCFVDQAPACRKEKCMMALLRTFPSMGLVSNTIYAIKKGLDLGLYESSQERWVEIQKSWKLEPAKKKIVLVE